jgi:hypothetical protein
MMIGNSMTATVLVARRLIDELRDKRDEVEARLALAQPSRQAAAPYLRIALRSAISPQIETTEATGLVFLPGAMTGLILAGVHPVQAVLVQAVVMFLILGSVAATAVIIALGLVRLAFYPRPPAAAARSAARGLRVPSLIGRPVTSASGRRLILTHSLRLLNPPRLCLPPRWIARSSPRSTPAQSRLHTGRNV